MALDTDECDRIIDAAAGAGVRLTVAKQTRHGDPEMREGARSTTARSGRSLHRAR